METFEVTIPEDKKDFFLQFLKLIGGKFKSENQTVNEEKTSYFSGKQKRILDERTSANETEFLDAEAELKKLQKKHGL